MKAIASGRFVGAMSAVQIILVVIIAFFSDPKDPTGVALMFTLLCLSGAAIAIAGVSRIFVKGRQWVFASLALVLWGVIGTLLGLAVQEVVSGIWPAPYVTFLMKNGIPMSALTALLIIAHFTETAIMKARKKVRFD